MVGSNMAPSSSASSPPLLQGSRASSIAARRLEHAALRSHHELNAQEFIVASKDKMVAALDAGSKVEHGSPTDISDMVTVNALGELEAEALAHHTVPTVVATLEHANVYGRDVASEILSELEAAALLSEENATALQSKGTAEISPRSILSDLELQEQRYVSSKLAEPSGMGASRPVIEACPAVDPAASASSAPAPAFAVATTLKSAPPLTVEECAKFKPVAADEVSRVCRGARNGRVLRKQTVLKADHYPSCRNTELPELIDGAPNFRQPTEIPVCGTAAPTMDGMRAVCERMAPHGQPIVWCNLRQEPVVYICGRPFSVKERETPFKAMENKGIQRSDVVQAEVLLKLEVIAEARLYGGRLLVLDESVPSDPSSGLCATGELFSYWEEDVCEATVLTPCEMAELVGLQANCS